MENLFIINLSIIARISSKYKIDLLLESNMSPKKFILMKKKISSPNIFFLFDCGNRAILKRDFFLDIKLFGKNIKHVHLKDKNSSNKNVLIGDGLVNFNLFFKALKKIKYRGSFTIESQRGANIFMQGKKNFNFFSNLIKKYKL